MERLTIKDDSGVYCPPNIPCETRCDDCKHLDNMINKLAQYEEAEEQGLLAKLPCKIGDVVYQASKFWNEVLERTVACIVLSSDNHIYVRNGCGDSFEFGVDVFLTKEEAEHVLSEMKRENK